MERFQTLQLPWEIWRIIGELADRHVVATTTPMWSNWRSVRWRVRIRVVGKKEEDR